MDSVEEHVEKQAKIIKQKEKQANAFIDLFPEEALQKARELDKKKKKKGKLGKLFGLTIAVKNNIAIKGKRLTCASKMLENYVAPYNASVIEKILAEDAIIIGTTNMDEFACGSDTTKSALKITHNPHDLNRVPGGSSGGSAAAIAAGFCDLSLGADTGGSIRCPASFCGVVGFKSTYGTVSRFGLADMAMSFEQIGPITKDVFGSALLLSIIAGEDYRDATTFGSEKKDFTAELKKKEAKKLRVGVPKEFFEGCDKQVEAIVKKKLSELEEFYEVKEISLPIARYAIPVYYLNVYAEFSSAMQKYDGIKYGFPYREGRDLIEAVSEARSNSLGREVKRRILLGTYITMQEFRDAWYTKTLKARSIMKREFEQAFKQVDIIAGPTNPVLPWRIGEKTEDPVQMYLADVLTVIPNIAGIPAGSINAGYAGKLPVGIQFMGKWSEDEVVFKAMKRVELI